MQNSKLNWSANTIHNSNGNSKYRNSTKLLQTTLRRFPWQLNTKVSVTKLAILRR